jgi:hypothetical protein
VAQAVDLVTTPSDHPSLPGQVSEVRARQPQTAIPVWELTWMAFAVADPESVSDGERCGSVLGPSRAMEDLRTTYILWDETVLELMQFDAPSAFAAR